MSRIEKLKKENPKFDISFLDILASIDPTTTYKYLPFLIKQVKNHVGANQDDLAKIIANELFSETFISTLEKFEEHCKADRIKNNDITKYKDIDEISAEVKIADELKKRKESEKQVVKLYEDNEYLVVVPLTYNSCKTYGSNTEWCITTESTWYSYVWKHRFIFIIDKNNNKKFAVSRTYNNTNDVKGWTENDKEINVVLLPIKKEILFLVIENIISEKYSIEITGLKENEIFDAKGNIINLKDAKNEDISFFIKTFSNVANKKFINDLSQHITIYQNNNVIKVADTNEEILKYLEYVKI